VRDADHTPPSSAEVKKELSYTSTRPMGPPGPVTGFPFTLFVGCMYFVSQLSGKFFRVCISLTAHYSLLNWIAPAFLVYTCTRANTHARTHARTHTHRLKVALTDL
jgi:hypothetical protein